MSQVAARNYTSLNAITAAATGTAFQSGGRTQATWGYVTTGSPTDVSVQFEVSHDGVNYEKYGSALDGTSSGMGMGTGAYNYCRLNCTALTGGTTPTLTGTIYLSG